jgi:hypothetical protein
MNRRFDLGCEFFLSSGSSWRQRTVSKLIGQFNGRLVGWPLARLGLFSIDTSLGGYAMPPMGVDDAILGYLSNPQMERDHGIGKIILQSTVGFDEHILDNIANIHALVETLVQSQLDHST